MKNSLSQFSLSNFRLIYILIFFSFQFFQIGKAQFWVQKGFDIDGDSIGFNLGQSVSISENGNIMAVSSQVGNGARGHVSVYEWSGSAWIQKGVDLIGSTPNNQFGFSISLSSNGDRIAIGSKWENGPIGVVEGRARVFEWSGVAWILVGSPITGEDDGDEFGYSVSISGDGQTLAVGAPNANEPGPAAGAVGHVRVFGWDGNNWIQKGGDLDGEFQADAFGNVVSLSEDGNTVAIGGYRNEDGDSVYFNYGQARVYTWNGGGWIQKGIDLDGDNRYDEFGFSLSLSDDGNKLAVGAPYHSVSGNNSNEGQVKVFSWNTGLGIWQSIGTDLIGENAADWFGYSVSLSGDGNTLAIGAPMHAVDTGNVRIFQWDGLQWEQIGQGILGEGQSDFSGWSVYLSGDGNTVVMGAIQNNPDGQTPYAGHARVFNYVPVGITEGPKKKPFLVYPNPSHGVVYLRSGQPSDLRVIVSNLLGQVFSEHQFGVNEEISLHLPENQGLYVLEIIPSTGAPFKRTVVKH